MPTISNTSSLKKSGQSGLGKEDALWLLAWDIAQMCSRFRLAVQMGTGMESQDMTERVFWELMILSAPRERNWIWGSGGRLPLHFQQNEYINKNLNWYYFQKYSVPLVVGWIVPPPPNLHLIIWPYLEVGPLPMLLRILRWDGPGLGREYLSVALSHRSDNLLQQPQDNNTPLFFLS